MYYVYVLENGANRYIGRTNNLRKRVREHNAGQNFSTKSPTNWKLIYYEAHLNFDDAKRREGYFKTSVGRRSLNRMLSSYNSVSGSFGARSSTAGKAGGSFTAVSQLARTKQKTAKPEAAKS